VIDPPYQWQVALAELDPVRGSEQAGSRPVLVVSNEAINEALSVVAVLPLTTYRPGRRVYSTEIRLPAEAAGQPNPSIVMAHQIRTVAKERLSRSYGWLRDEILRQQVRSALRVYLDLS